MRRMHLERAYCHLIGCLISKGVEPKVGAKLFSCQNLLLCDFSKVYHSFSHIWRASNQPSHRPSTRLCFHFHPCSSAGNSSPDSLWRLVFWCPAASAIEESSDTKSSVLASNPLCLCEASDFETCYAITSSPAPTAQPEIEGETKRLYFTVCLSSNPPICLGNCKPFLFVLNLSFIIL